MAVTTKTFAVGEKYHHFVVDGKKYQAGHYDYDIDVNGIVTITRLVGGNVTAPVSYTHLDVYKRQVQKLKAYALAAKNHWQPIQE